MPKYCYPPEYFFKQEREKRPNNPFKDWIKAQEAFDRWEETKKKKEESNKKKDETKISEHPFIAKRFSVIHVFLIITGLFPVYGPVYYYLMKAALEAFTK